MTGRIDRRNALLVRDVSIFAGIGVLLIVLLEIVLRLFIPQTVRYTSINGLTLGKPDSLIGHVNMPTAHVTVEGPEYAVEYRVSEEGLRDESQHAIPKPTGLARILLLGDSFTFGDGGNYSDIWPVVFEGMLRREGYDIDVVKAGVNGYDTSAEVLYLERLLPEYDPDFVVLAFLPNDLFTNDPVSGESPMGTIPGRRPVDVEAMAGASQGIDLHCVRLAKRLVIRNDRLYAGLYLITARKEFFTVPWSNELAMRIDVTKDLLKRAHAFCMVHGVEFIVLSIPQQFQVLVAANGYELDGIDVFFVDELFSRFAAEQGFDWITTMPDLIETYRSESTDLYYRFDGHLNPAGNRCVGESFFRQFRRLFDDRL
ncbi:MAG: hypothetical protein JSV33_05505 [bacterium]|nr:MAG: hypothetical protein JSV33_05505 [bacterium]